MKKMWLIKVGGELLSNLNIRKRILDDLVRWSKKHPLVLVHGGGPQIEAELIKNKVQMKFVDGRRVTTPQAMIYVERILSGQVNKGVTADLVAKKVKAVGLSGRDGGLIVGRPIPNLDRAAKPVKVDIKILKVLMEQHFIPIVSSVASDSKGNAVNINADDAAFALAEAMKVDSLIFLTDTRGVLDKYQKRIPHLKCTDVNRLIQSRVIKGGMIPKVQSAALGISHGIKNVFILNGYKGIKFSSGTKISK